MSLWQFNARQIVMKAEEQASRSIKRQILDLLKSGEVGGIVEHLLLLPAQKVINPLLSSLGSTEENIKWKAVSALGAIVSRLADQNMESAREVMRRLMWNLNAESGGIGWGSPEALGEIMARHRALAEEYSPLLISYLRPDGNFLEHELLQQGVVWALGRLAHSFPPLMVDAVPYLTLYLKSSNVVLRGLAAWALEPLKVESARESLQALMNDRSTFMLYANGALTRERVSDLAARALA
jgi:HEAT repeat protein